MRQTTPTPRLAFVHLLEENRPQAMAWVRGGSSNPDLSGLVKFYDTPYGGILIEAEFFGLPDISKQNSSDFYAMHIHESGDCSAMISPASPPGTPGRKSHAA